MTESTGNLVLELLRQMRSEITNLRNEMCEAFNRTELRLGLIEQALANLLSVSAPDREEIRVLKSRIERIEHHLDAYRVSARRGGARKGAGARTDA